MRPVNPLSGLFLVPVAILLAAPVPGFAQHQHHDHRTDEHHHAGAPVECSTLAAPPWTGLGEDDRAQIRSVEAAVAHLRTPEAAVAAGFSPAFGHIPTMGVHWVHPGRMRAGVRLDEPDHLMFARIDGREELVGVAFAFRAPPDAPVPDLFESELAAWHDHPELGGRGQTLHMLHVWFIDSPYGPFAGNNFLLPFRVRGVAAPDPCWLGGDEDVERLELVASTLSLLAQLGRGDEPGIEPGAIGALRGPIRDRFARGLERLEGWERALDLAARRHDREGWVEAADGLLAALGPAERRAVEALRARVTGVQQPGALRGG